MIKLILPANLAQIAELSPRRAALSRNFNVSFHILCAPVFVKGNLSHPKRLPFAS